MKSPLNLKWVLAHVPYDLFLRAANAFSKEIAEKTNGEITVEILGKPDWEEKYNNGVKITNLELINRVEKGEVEMTQLYTTTLGRANKDFFALDLPYLFRDHDHAARVFDGEVGKGILEGLAKTSGVRGLAFTYSGGYKMMATNKKIHSLKDLSGMTMRCGISPVSFETFKAAGMNPVPKGVDGFADAVAEGEVEGGEQTFPRYFRSRVNTVTSHVSTTDHALFLTSIIISSKIWDTLSDEHKRIIEEAVSVAAFREREESLIDGDLAKQRCKTEGIEVNEWNEDLRKEFQQATESVYDKFDKFFIDPEIVKKILNS